MDSTKLVDLPRPDMTKSQKDHIKIYQGQLYKTHKTYIISSAYNIAHLTPLELKKWHKDHTVLANSPISNVINSAISY